MNFRFIKFLEQVLSAQNLSRDNRNKLKIDKHQFLGIMVVFMNYFKKLGKWGSLGRRVFAFLPTVFFSRTIAGDMIFWAIGAIWVFGGLGISKVIMGGHGFNQTNSRIFTFTDRLF